MAVLWYMQCKNILSDTKGSLSSEVPAAAIARATQEVQVALETDMQVGQGMKQGTWHRIALAELSLKSLVHLPSALLEALWTL